jgi:hypothetical protein
MENNQDRNLATGRSPAVEIGIEFMWKDEVSNVGNCPAMYKAKGGYVIQGKTLGEGTLAQLRDLGGDETAVFVPANVIERIRNL